MNAVSLALGPDPWCAAATAGKRGFREGAFERRLAGDMAPLRLTRINARTARFALLGCPAALEDVPAGSEPSVRVTPAERRVRIPAVRQHCGAGDQGERCRGWRPFSRLSRNRVTRTQRELISSKGVCSRFTPSFLPLYAIRDHAKYAIRSVTSWTHLPGLPRSASPVTTKAPTIAGCLPGYKKPPVRPPWPCRGFP